MNYNKINVLILTFQKTKKLSSETLVEKCLDRNFDVLLSLSSITLNILLFFETSMKRAIKGTKNFIYCAIHFNIFQYKVSSFSSAKYKIVGPCDNKKLRNDTVT